MEYEHFDILEVAVQCGVQLHSAPQNSVEYKALCPFCGDTKYHLGLNREKDCFFCFRCKEKGTSVSLYAKLHGISNLEAYKALKNGMETVELKPAYFAEEVTIPLRSPEDRHNVYYDFLNMLTLKKHHAENLQSRGLSFQHMRQFMYRSIPLDNVFRRSVLEQLSAKHDLLGIPGFYWDERGDVQMYYKKCGGIFVPVCNKDGYIQGLQMRLDISGEEKKFRWFSSKHFPNGTGAKAWIHIVGDTTAKEAVLTEGAMKADISSVLSLGQLFVAVPGVNAVKELPNVLRELGVQKVYECFDMDKTYKPEVKDALISLKKILRNSGVECVSCVWNPEYKGIDNYCLAKSQEEIQSIAA